MASTRNYLRIEISGESLSDLEIALDEVRRKVSDGFLSGFGSNETGDYEFNLTEELGQPLAPVAAGEWPIIPTPQDYIQLAQCLHPDLRIDDEPCTVDITDDGLGAYVQTQVWISADRLVQAQGGPMFNGQHDRL